LDYIIQNKIRISLPARCPIPSPINNEKRSSIDWVWQPFGPEAGQGQRAKTHVYVSIVLGVHSPATLIGISHEEIMIRRQVLSKIPQLFGLGLLGLGAANAQETMARKPLKIMMKSAWGSDDPTKAAFPFLHGHALAEAGHEVQIFLLGEAVSVMRKSVASALVPVGWPPLVETLDKVVAKHIQIYACGACCRARSVAETDLSQWGAKFGNPTIFVSLVEWADRIITE
jgi:predicted peroxiredoxin